MVHLKLSSFYRLWLSQNVTVINEYKCDMCVVNCKGHSRKIATDLKS